jgi:hypothetical protein
MIMVLIFLAAAAGFLVHDYMVQKRQRAALNTAARSNAINCFFPFPC